MSPASPDAFARWYAATRARYLPLVSFPDVRKGIQALSTTYVERRGRLDQGKALDGAGKRAAFALFYAPLHFLVVREIVRALGAASPPPRTIIDLGCGTGASGAAWASCAVDAGGTPRLELVDQSGWAVDEARQTLKSLDWRGTAWRGPLEAARLPGKGGAILAAYALNELDGRERGRLLQHFLRATERGSRVLVVEPISRAVTPWWDEWAAAFVGRGGRSDDWRFPADLPGELQELDRSSGLSHEELTARSLWLAGNVAPL
jgi:hypothetical protein